MTNAEIGQRAAARRTAISTAAAYLRDINVVFPDYASWADEVTRLADRLMPWLCQDLRVAVAE